MSIKEKDAKKSHELKQGTEISFPSDNTPEGSGIFGRVEYFTEDSVTIKMPKGRTIKASAKGMALFINEIEFIIVQTGNMIRLKRKEAL